MTHNFQNELDATRRRMEKCQLHPEDLNLLKEFDRKLRRRPETDTAQHENNLSRMVLIARHRHPPEDADPEDIDDSQYHGVALSEALKDEEAALKIDDWIDRRRYNGEMLSEKTKVHFRTAIRGFGSVLTDHELHGDSVPPPSMDKIYGGIQETWRNGMSPLIREKFRNGIPKSNSCSGK